MRSRAAWSAGWPRISIVPESGPRTFITMRRVVVLPAPFGPSRPNTLPRGTSRERSFTATWPANALVTPRRRIAVSLTGPMLSQGIARAGCPLGTYTRPRARTGTRGEGGGGDPRDRARARERGRLRHPARPRQAGLRDRHPPRGPARRPLRDRIGPLRPADAAQGAALARAAAALGSRSGVRHPAGGPRGPGDPAAAVAGLGGPGLRGLRLHRERARGGGFRRRLRARDRGHLRGLHRARHPVRGRGAGGDRGPARIPGLRRRLHPLGPLRRPRHPGRSVALAPRGGDRGVAHRDRLAHVPGGPRAHWARAGGGAQLPRGGGHDGPLPHPPGGAPRTAPMAGGRADPGGGGAPEPGSAPAPGTDRRWRQG